MPLRGTVQHRPAWDLWVITTRFLLFPSRFACCFPLLKQNDAADPAGRGSDAAEKRRTEKMLIARMLDMDEPFMTEKVQPKAIV